jgi:hypothetical protein
VWGLYAPRGCKKNKALFHPSHSIDFFFCYPAATWIKRARAERGVGVDPRGVNAKPTPSLISHQPAVLLIPLGTDRPPSINQPTVLFSRNEAAPASQTKKEARVVVVSLHQRNRRKRLRSILGATTTTLLSHPYFSSIRFWYRHVSKFDYFFFLNTLTYFSWTTQWLFRIILHLTII